MYNTELAAFNLAYFVTFLLFSAGAVFLHFTDTAVCQTGQVFTSLTNWIYIYVISTAIFILHQIVVIRLTTWLKHKDVYKCLLYNNAMQFVMSLSFVVLLIVLLAMYNRNCYNDALYLWIFTVIIISGELIFNIARFALFIAVAIKKHRKKQLAVIHTYSNFIRMENI